MSHSPEKLRFAGLVIAGLAACVDQWSKTLLFDAARSTAFPVQVTSWFNLVLVANRGVSFGMFAHQPHWMPWVLTGITSVISLFVLYWLMQAVGAFTILGLGFILGGALGNIADRVRLGAVTDFLDLHWQEYHWPAFNVADSFIFMGVVILIAASIVRRFQ